MVEIVWTHQSIEDIYDIAAYIGRDSEKYAKIQVQRIYQRTRILLKHIDAGRVVPEIYRQDIRELILGNYRIIYRKVSDSEVHILTIHHSARLLENNPRLKLD